VATLPEAFGKVFSMTKSKAEAVRIGLQYLVNVSLHMF